ncbi:uncharacterized protein FRV6_05830 [Fusarium oxysporum]|uniref:Uncharacterized protein n=1 Tax=Fusarium oxysporum TaxID=5507 RepID=A0A2H3SYY4_FUSOX|nr:uncharacterized protein FRV6_05830 [Fusarium oxysporum]
MPRAEKEDANEFHVDLKRTPEEFHKTYDYGGEDPLVFPMHGDCYELLGKVAKPRKIDTAALYQVFTAHLPPPSHGSPNALDFDYGPGMPSLSPVSIHDGQATDITESALKKAHKSIVQEIGPLPNVPTGPAADRGRLKMHRPGRANPTELGRITINGEHERHLEITKWLCMQATKDISDTVWENKFSTEFAWILEFLPSKEEIKRRQVDRFLFCKVINDLGSGRGTFLIEQARHHEDNHYDVYDDDEVGEHGEVFDTRLVTVYDCQGPQSFAAPLHVDCYEILQDAYKPRKVTLSALYDTLTGYCSPTRNKHQPNSLDLDYGLPSGPFEVDMVNLNDEFALASPSQVDECIEDMVQELFRISRKSKKPKNRNIPQTSFANGNGEKISPSKI